MRLEFKWDKPVAVIAEESVGGNKGRLFLANEAKRFMDPYVPYDSSFLSSQTETYVENDIGIVEYVSPYAHYQWEGEIYGPNYPIFENGVVVRWYSPPHKTPTGREIEHNKFKHPLATSHWDKAMMTTRKGDLTKAYQNYLRSGIG